jgi:hypothetical protein
MAGKAEVDDDAMAPRVQVVGLATTRLSNPNILATTPRANAVEPSLDRQAHDPPGLPVKRQLSTSRDANESDTAKICMKCRSHRVVCDA